MEPILFFDGTCIMCNGLVNFVLRHDRKKQVKFATLQGQTAQRLVDEPLRSQLSTVVLYDGGRTYVESDAIINLFIYMGGLWRLAWLLKIFPKFIRSNVYRWIAKNRYRWFGKQEACRLFSKEERLRILD